MTCRKDAAERLVTVPRRNRKILATVAAACLATLPAILAGCGNPATSAVHAGIEVVGIVVDDVETEKLSEQLVGQSPSAADEKLGQVVDVFSDVDAPREWRAYPTPMDVLNTKRYVIVVENNRITMVEMVSIGGEKLDIPLQLVYQEKLKGKTPDECTAAADMGRPIMRLRSKSTGQLHHLYDARLIKELPKPHYMVVRFDADGRCEKVKFVEVAAKGS